MKQELLQKPQWNYQLNDLLIMNVKLWTLNFLKDLNFWRQQAWQTQLETKATVVYHIFKLTAREKVHQQFSLFFKKKLVL